MTKRIIPCLDVKNGRVVKGVNFEDLREIHSPVELAKYYSGSGADELVFYDITASSEGRKLFADVLQETVAHVSIPLTVGGGSAPRGFRAGATLWRRQGERQFRRHRQPGAHPGSRAQA